jgi:hypothetical protein
MKSLLTLSVAFIAILVSTSSADAHIRRHRHHHHRYDAAPAARGVDLAGNPVIRDQSQPS